MILACNEADPFAYYVSETLRVLQNLSKGKTCFKCGQSGHWMKHCPMAQHSPMLTTGSTEPRPSLCPRCRRGKHWAASCRSKTDVAGNPLPPLLPQQGNRGRALPRGPQRHNTMGTPRPMQPFVAPAQSQENSINYASLTITINGQPFTGHLDSGADTTCISPQFWPSSWPAHPTLDSVSGVAGTVKQVLLSSQSLTWVDAEGDTGTISPYIIPDLPINLWGRDLMEQMGLSLMCKNPQVLQ